MIIVLILITNVFKCMSYQLNSPKTQHYHVPIVNNKRVNQSILYDKENNNGMLINSILRDISTDQVVLVLSGRNITTLGLSNVDPNIIILTETLDTADFETEEFMTLLHSHWSPLYLVVTSKAGIYACENGTLDKRVFSDTKYYLNELWQTFRITRVIMSFPYICPDHYVIYTGKEVSRVNAPVYNRNIKLIKPRNKGELEDAIIRSGNPRYLAEGYPLRANIFNRFPTSISECDIVYRYTKLSLENINGLCGLDGFIMQDFTDYYKYELILPKDDTCDLYGYVDTRNNITLGSLGCVVREKIDISFNSRFIVQYSTENYYYLHYIYEDSLCVLLKKPSHVPLWHYAHNMLEAKSWLVLISCIFVQGTVTWVLAKIYYYNRLSDERPLKLHTYIFNTIVSTLFGCLIKNDGRFLILKGSSLICAVIFLADYQGHVSNQFTTRSHYPKITTLQGLYESETILYTSTSILELLASTKDSSDPNQLAFVNRVQLRGITYEEIETSNNAATVVRKEDVMVDLLYNHTDKYGTPVLYVIDECFNVYYLAFIARKGFVFLEESLKFMMRVLEAGLPNRYYIWTRRTFNSADPTTIKGPEPRPYNSIRLSKLRSAFGLLIVGYVACTIVFIIEIWKGRKTRK